MANLGRSEKLLREFQNGKISWSEFRRRYTDEVFEGDAIDRKNKTIKNHGQKFTLRLLQKLAKRGTVTFLCHCAEDQRHCHRHVLAAILNAKV
jgi:uncharacterized protein YeaO (DUF488 family)